MKIAGEKTIHLKTRIAGQFGVGAVEVMAAGGIFIDLVPE
jgi:hypothetical protein